MKDVKATVFIVRNDVKVVSSHVPMSRLAGLLTKLIAMVSSNGCQQALTRSFMLYLHAGLQSRNSGMFQKVQLRAMLA